MRPLRFCQACGSKVETPDKEGGARCGACGRTWYQNMAPTVGAAIVRDGKALATIRAFDPQKGKHDVPGGFLKPDEEPLEGLRREVMEELSIEIASSMDQVVQMIPHPYGEDGQWVLSIGFKATWVSGEPEPADDVAAIEWVGIEDLDGIDFAWEHDRTLLRRTLEDEQEPD